MVGRFPRGVYPQGRQARDWSSRTRSSTTGGEAQPVCTTTTVFSARTAVPAHVRARLADDDGAL